MSEPDTQAEVTALTVHGTVRGEQLGPVQRYLGIPYAADPVGDLRLRPPARPASWDGVRDCRTPSPAPPQGGDPLLESVVGSERIVADEAGCLTVNVWTPGAAGRRPVLVWVHGGGYVQGRGLQVWTDGARLAERYDMVVVSLNYRLGALGWLHVAELLGEEYAQSANLGLQDQIAALGWVRDNIARFGGDPECVTVAGESAGGGSVAMLLAAPAARPLFHRAILQSPPADTLRNPAEGAEVAADFAAVLSELADGDVESGDIRTAPAALLLAAQEQLAARYPLARIPFAPVVDGAVLPLSPVQALRNGACAHIPVLAGTTEHEGRLFTGLGPQVTPEAFDAALADAFPDPERAARAREVYAAHEGTDFPTRSLAALITDQLFRSQTDALLEAQAAGGGRAWSYLFREPTPQLGGELGAAHTVDIPYAFDLLDAPGLARWIGEAAPQSLADAMSGAWAHFARHGEPRHQLLPPWPEFEPSGRPAMQLSARPEVAYDPLPDRRRLWQG
ncbi:carboxylesterase/lipase family protein [Streptomyces sp. NPDC059009]|uniref:carboxylesterase/lipase family protein n=1 Tax=Streptomyces sp. NPDC059009 TaxID=3346694 RepID=UPI0036803EB3